MLARRGVGRVRRGGGESEGQEAREQSEVDLHGDYTLGIPVYL